MKPCTMAGAPCPHEAVATVRIDGVGDRAMCGPHRDWVVGHGMGRELEANSFVPEWRKNLTSRDQTGMVLAR